MDESANDEPKAKPKKSSRSSKSKVERTVGIERRPACVAGVVCADMV